MNKVLVSCITAILLIPALGCANIQLSAVPTNAIIHVAEPVSFTVTVRNSGGSSVSGLFILNGRYDGFTIDVRKIDKAKSQRFFNALMWEAVKDDMLFQPVTLKPNEETSANYDILYNVRTKEHVFAEPGEYEVSFRLRWSHRETDSISTTTSLTVVEWDKDVDKQQIEALNLWNCQEIASIYQDNAMLSDSALGRLRKLKENYADTVYGSLATTILNR